MTEDQITQNQLERGFLRIDLDAIRGNLEKMHRTLRSGTGMIAVIKANGYGHGAVRIAQALEEVPYVFGYAVATAEEAFELAAVCKKPIMLLGYAFPSVYEEFVRAGIRPSVFREDTLEALCDIALRTGRKAVIHIPVDTGMGRIGITPDDAGLAFVQKAAKMPGIEIEGLFTHFARADEEDVTPALEQLRLFTGFADRIRQELGVEIPHIHAMNSAGILRIQAADTDPKNLDLVRAGITMYGLDPSGEVTGRALGLQPAMSLCSHISFVKEVLPGQSISYGGTFTASEKMLVATVPLGYGDGYPRALSAKGEVLIRGRRCQILGRVCMDQFMVDVSAIPDVRPFERVTLLGRDGAECITAEELGALSGRFNYELVCLLGVRLPRAYESGGTVFFDPGGNP